MAGRYAAVSDLKGITTADLSGDIPESVFIMFQMTFAIITPGSDRRSVCGAYEVQCNPAVYCAVARARLCTRHPLGCGAVVGCRDRGVIDLAGGIVGARDCGCLGASCWLTSWVHAADFPKKAYTSHTAPVW